MDFPNAQKFRFGPRAFNNCNVPVKGLTRELSATPEAIRIEANEHGLFADHRGFYSEPLLIGDDAAAFHMSRRMSDD